MDHNDIRHKLSDYIDGAVADPEKKEIEEHLTTCAPCGDALAELRKAIEYVKEIEDVESPPWMAGKIMAQVRAETEQKKSLFQRLFYPLTVKLPIQAVAVLFLSVTAYYLYQNINPAQKYAEAPMEIAKKDIGQKDRITREAKPLQTPAPPAKKPVQRPGYKALDMKYAYEKPAPPIPLGKAAEPAPASPTAPAPVGQEQPSGLGDNALERRGFAKAPEGESAVADTRQEESGGALKQEKSEAQAGLSAERKARTASPRLKAAARAEELKGMQISLSVPDAAKAVQDIDKIVQQLGGRLVGRSGEADAPVITLFLDSGKIRELKTKLRAVGEVKEKEKLPEGRQGIVQVEIVISPAPQP